MNSKFNYYDLLGIVVPGVLGIAGVALLLHFAGIETSMPEIPGSVLAVVLVFLAFFVGQVVQALGQVMERLYHWSWGGKPNALLVQGKRGYAGFGTDDGMRIASLLLADRNHIADTNIVEMDGERLFAYARSLVHAGNLQERAERFQGLYAYHRALLTEVLALFALDGVTFVGKGLFSKQWLFEAGIALPVLGFLVVLLWNRTRQRAYYYAREVMLMAEQVLRADAMKGLPTKAARRCSIT